MLLFAQNALSNSPLQFTPPVSLRDPANWMFWAVLAGIPVSIILLYFLKLRRKPVQVPSTLLWRRSIEDLHVNSLFQRLRRNLLLFLQLLAVFLAIFALFGPQLRGSSRIGQRHVLVVDNSGSMSATDVGPNRLGRAKAEAKKIVEAMGPTDLAMIIAFADSAKVVSAYTGNKRELTARIDSIQPTCGGTSLLDALTVASGLANPSRQFGEGDKAGEFGPPRLTIFSDGGFPDVSGFRLGKLVPEVVVLGPSPPPLAPGAKPDPNALTPSDNVAILALQTGRNEENPDQFQVFGRVRNFRDEEVLTRALLFRHELDAKKPEPRLIDAIELKIAPSGTEAFKFDLADTGAIGLEVRLDVKDALANDNSAFAAIGAARRARVLLVTAGNRYLSQALSTAVTGEAAEILEVKPEAIEGSGDVARSIAAGEFDLVVFDNVRPKEAPPANALYFGQMPPGEAFAKVEEVEGPIILDWDIAHPLLQYIRDLSLVRIAKAKIVEPPPGSSRLIETNHGVLGFATPRDGYTDVVIGFSIFGDNPKLNSDWYMQRGFPMFVFNAIQLLGNVQTGVNDDVHRPGLPVAVRAEPKVDQVTITSPDGESARLKRSTLGTFVFNGADAPGLYRYGWDDQTKSLFAVNLFSDRESDIAPRGLAPPGVTGAQAEAYQIKIGYTPVQGTRRSVPDRKDWWWPVTLAALGVVLFEWYIYNRRVYI